MNALRITNLKKTFSDVSSNQGLPVLEDVTVAVEDACIVSVVGPNGVGKSTFLRLLASLLQPDSGTITLNGKALDGMRIGYVPSTNPVFPWRRVDDDIALPLEILGFSRDERRSYAAGLLRQFSCDLSPNRRTYALSSGQRQIVNLCRSLVGPNPPGLLLLDEPFSSLDPASRNQLIALLEKVEHVFRTLIILTTHDLDSACAVSDYVLPFRSRPVNFTGEDVLTVPLTRPRSPSALLTPEYRSMRETLHSMFRDVPGSPLYEP